MMDYSQSSRRNFLKLAAAASASSYFLGAQRLAASRLNNVNLDDFAFDVDGNLYATTHIYNSVVRIAPNDQITTIAKAEQGVASSTALAFGREWRNVITAIDWLRTYQSGSFRCGY